MRNKGGKSGNKMRVEGGIFFWVGGAQCAIERKAGGWNERGGLVSYFQAGAEGPFARGGKKFVECLKNPDSCAYS